MSVEFYNISSRLKGNLKQIESVQQKITNLQERLDLAAKNPNFYRNEKIINIAKIIGIIGLTILAVALAPQFFIPALVLGGILAGRVASNFGTTRAREVTVLDGLKTKYRRLKLRNP